MAFNGLDNFSGQVDGRSAGSRGRTPVSGHAVPPGGPMRGLGGVSGSPSFANTGARSAGPTPAPSGSGGFVSVMAPILHAASPGGGAPRPSARTVSRAPEPTGPAIAPEIIDLIRQQILLLFGGGF